MAVIPENVMVLWPGDHSAIAGMSGWSRVTAYDGRFYKGRVSGCAGNSGSTSHAHVAPAHNHTIPAHTHGGTSDAAQGHRVWNGGGILAAPGQTHTHAWTSGSCAGGTAACASPTWSCTTIEPPYAQMIAIKSDGTPTGFPDDSVVFYNNATAPSCWTDHAASREKYIKAPAACGNGIDNGSVSAAGGGSHYHSGSSHTHGAPSAHDHSDVSVTGTTAYSSSTTCSCDGMRKIGSGGHAHAMSFNTAAAGSLGGQTSANTAAFTYVPPYHVLLGIQNTSGSNKWLEEAIVMFDGAASAVPDDWTICNGDNNDSGNATPNLNGKFVLMASDGGSVGGTGTTTGHDHTDPATHTHNQAHSHGVVNQPSGTALGWVCDGAGQYRNHNNASNIGYHYHGPGSTNTSSVTTASCGQAQTVNTNCSTEPIHRTVLFLSAPEEPADLTPNPYMVGANF